MESAEKALIKMCLAEVLVRRVKDSSEALWGAKASPEIISSGGKNVYVQVEEWQNRKLAAEYPYVHMDGICLTKNWGGAIESVAALVAIDVNEDGNRK